MSEHYEAKLLCDALSKLLDLHVFDFCEALQKAINDTFPDRGDEWQARLYAYMMESDSLDFVAVNRLMEAANG